MLLDHLLWAIAQLGAQDVSKQLPNLWLPFQMLSKSNQSTFLKEIYQIIDCRVAHGGFLGNELSHYHRAEIE